MYMYRLTYFSNPKTNGFLAALAIVAALSLGSCSQGEVPGGWQSGNEGSIVFDAYVSGSTQTRASVADFEWLRNYGFGVFASADGQTPNLMYNQKVEWGKYGGWQYTPEQSWSGNNLSFFAYAPYASAPEKKDYGVTGFSGSDAAGDPFLTFKVPKEVNKQTDLLYANKLDLMQGDVQLEFKHALSRISFRPPKISDSNDTISSFSRIDKLHLQSEQFAVSGKLNLHTGAWSDIEQSDVVYELGSEDFVESGTTSADRYLMVIPPTGIVKIMVTLTYKVITKDPNLPNGQSEFANTVTAPLEIEFKAGKAYDIGFKVTPTAMTFDAFVSDWPDTEEEDWGNKIES